MPWPYHSGTTYGITESIQESECYGMTKIIGKALPNIPWEDKPAGETMPMWRFSGNPIIGRHGNKRANSVFNSAVVPFEDGFAGVFRCDSRSISMDLFAGRSKDGYHWEIEDEPLRMEGAEEEILHKEYRYDARITPLDGKYYITWCNGYHGPTIGVAWTEDFKTFHQLENAFLPFNRNGVLFPRKIGGMYMMMSRPSDKWPYALWRYLRQPVQGSGILGPSPLHDGHHQGQRFRLAVHQNRPRPAPIETDEGWLCCTMG